MRKFILWFYVFLVTLIIGAVFMIGCGESSSGSGSRTYSDDRNLGTKPTSTTADYRSSWCDTQAIAVNGCQGWHITGPSNGLYTCWGEHCQ
jgi:hypothetical protein